MIERRKLIVADLDNQGKSLIVKSNRLIEASYKLTTQEQRLILLMSSMIKPEDKDFNTYQITVKDFNRLVGIKGEGGYDKTKDVTKRLLERVLSIRSEKSLLQISWLSSAEYFKGKGYVELSFDPKLKPYLLQLKQFFTQYQLKDVVRLKRAYSVRIYELLKQYERVGNRSFDLLELRHILGLRPEEYKLYGHFKSRILKPAQKELEASTNLKFDFKEKKQGRKVVGIVFLIKQNAANKKKPVPDSKKETSRIEDINPDLSQRLKEYFCLSSVQIEEVMTKFGEERILENLAYVEDKQRKGTIEKIGPYTFKAICEDYRLQMSLFDVEKKEEEEKKRKEESEKALLERLDQEFDRYRDEEVSKFKKSLSDSELEGIEASLKDEIEERYGKRNIVVKKLIELALSKELAEKAGVSSREEWIQREKSKKTG